MCNELKEFGYEFPANPKVLFVTPLNSIKTSHLNQMKKHGVRRVLSIRIAQSFMTISHPTYISLQGIPFSFLEGGLDERGRDNL